jgi:hypothetical protein
MIRFGFHRVDQFQGGATGFQQLLRRGHLDYRLLRTGIPPSDLEIAIFEDVTRRMQLSSGIFRTTTPGRFRDLDQWITPVLSRHFSPGLPVDARDWAASDCSTSAAWHPILTAAFPQATLTASDLNTYLIEMAVEGEGSYIFDAEFGLLQYVSPPLVIRVVPPESPWLPVNWLLARRAQGRLRKLLQDRQIRLKDVKFEEETPELRQNGITFRQIPLIHPRAVTLARQTRSFRVTRHSVFEPSPVPADVIRTMNILNKVYFDTDALARAARNIWVSLKPEGLWIVGRTVQDEPIVHHVSILVKTGEGFHVIERYNEQSEIEDIALAVRM